MNGKDTTEVKCPSQPMILDVDDVAMYCWFY
jgi:hypothetical protein